MISDVKPAAEGSALQAGSQSSFIADSPIDPKILVQVDALVLEKTSHPFQLAPFLVVVKPDKSAVLLPCRSSIATWNPEKGRVYSVFGTCPWLDEKCDVKTHTVGFFAINPSISSDLVVYIIDGKEHNENNDENYLACRNAAVDVFKTRVMNLPSSTHHSTRTVGFSSMKANDSINSSLHVRQCLRELAGMLSSVVGVLSADVLLDIVNTGFSSEANAFHNDALFDGVRIRMARRCWWKDLEDVTVCLLNGDMNLVQYAGSYGTMVTAPLSDEEEGLEARNAKLIVSTLCAFCNKNVPKTRYCGKACFKRCWGDHNRLHQQQAMVYLEQQQQNQLQERESELRVNDSDSGDDDDDDDDEDAVVDSSDASDDKTQPNAAAMKVDDNAISDVTHDNVDDDEAKPKAAEVDTDPAVKTAGVDIASPPVASGGVRITGIMGPSATLNGVYEATREMSGNMPVYVKVGDKEVCMEYYANNMQWQVKKTEHKGGDLCFVCCDVPVKCLPEKCPAGKWEVGTGFMLVPLHTVTVSLVSKEEVEACREELEREAARVVIGRHNVCITGATGVNAGHINGVYQPTEELCGNATVYIKVEDENMCMEYNSSSQSWLVTLTAAKGTQLCAARCAVPAKCLPEECPVGKWYVYEDPKKFVPQRAVTVSLLSDDVASAVVGPGDDDDEDKPKAAMMKVDTDPAAAQTAGVDIASPRITGTMGPYGDLINGVYEATREMSGDIPVYAKVGNNDVCLEYHAPTKMWQVKSTDNKGKDRCWAHCVVPLKCLPEECPAGTWQGCDAPQPSVKIFLVSKVEVEAYRDELEREAAREVKGRHNVRITGATSIKAGLINGVYKPTNEMSGKVTVYQKVVDGNVWLEYNVASKSWQVKPKASEGTSLSWANCSVFSKRLPQECPAGKWYVYDGTKFVPQPAIKVRRN